MTPSRISDTDLQRYLDGDPTLDRRAIDARLKTDPEARQRLNLFRRLYFGLERAEGMMPSADLADRVIARVEAMEGERGEWLEYCLIGLMIVAGVVAAVWLTGMGDMVAGYWSDTLDLIGGIGLPDLKDRGILIIAGIAVLTLFGFADRLLPTLRHR